MIDEDFARKALAPRVLFDHVDLAGIDACLRQRRFRRDEIVLHQSDPGDAPYIVASGRVNVLLPSPDNGESAILATVGRVRFFGGLAMLDGQSHSASVVAHEPTETLVLGRMDFERDILVVPDPGRLMREARR